MIKPLQTLHIYILYSDCRSEVKTDMVYHPIHLVACKSRGRRLQPVQFSKHVSVWGFFFSLESLVFFWVFFWVSPALSLDLPCVSLPSSLRSLTVLVLSVCLHCQCHRHYPYRFHLPAHFCFLSCFFSFLTFSLSFRLLFCLVFSLSFRLLFFLASCRCIQEELGHGLVRRPPDAKRNFICACSTGPGVFWWMIFCLMLRILKPHVRPWIVFKRVGNLKLSFENAACI